MHLNYELKSKKMTHQFFKEALKSKVPKLKAVIDQETGAGTGLAFIEIYYRKKTLKLQ